MPEQYTDVGFACHLIRVWRLPLHEMALDSACLSVWANRDVAIRKTSSVPWEWWMWCVVQGWMFQWLYLIPVWLIHYIRLYGLWASHKDSVSLSYYFCLLQSLARSKRTSPSSPSDLHILGGLCGEGQGQDLDHGPIKDSSSSKLHAVCVCVYFWTGHWW